MQSRQADSSSSAWDQSERWHVWDGTSSESVIYSQSKSPAARVENQHRYAVTHEKSPRRQASPERRRAAGDAAIMLEQLMGQQMMDELPTLSPHAVAAKIQAEGACHGAELSELTESLGAHKCSRVPENSHCVPL